MLGLGFRLRPTTAGWTVGVCVCSCARSANPGWAGRCGSVCLSLGFGCPLHSWLGCWGLCVLVCARRLYPATPGCGMRCRSVDVDSCFGLPTPLLAGVLGSVCACVRAPLAPCRSWLGCAVWVCVLGLGLRLRPATPGCGVGVCVCLCARFACTPSLLAGACGVGLCTWVRVSAAPFTPGWGIGVCVCLCARASSTPPLLAGVCGVDVCAWARVSAALRHSWLRCWGLCVFVCALCLYPVTPGLGCAVWVCALGLGFSLPPHPLAGMLGSVCVCVRAPLVPRQSWMGCAVWMCVLGLRFGLRPGTPGRGAGLCVCLCACLACTPSLLAGVCAVWVGCCLAPVPVPWFVA